MSTRKIFRVRNAKTFIMLIRIQLYLPASSKMVGGKICNLLFFWIYTYAVYSILDKIYLWNVQVIINVKDSTRNGGNDHSESTHSSHIVIGQYKNFIKYITLWFNIQKSFNFLYLSTNLLIVYHHTHTYKRSLHVGVVNPVSYSPVGKSPKHSNN